jgi:hypothetical protein
MTIELALCIGAAILALPVSRSIAIHYVVFAEINVSLLGYEYADASLLAGLFVMLALMDAMLVMAGGRKILLISAAASCALAIESMLNTDWLLNNVTYLSAIVNAAIGVYLIREYHLWMKSKLGR